MALRVQCPTAVEGAPPPSRATPPSGAYAGNWQRAQFWSTVLAPTGSADAQPTSGGVRTQVPLKVVDTQRRSSGAANTPGRARRKHAGGSLRCTLCYSSFGQRGDLMRHIRVTHLGERKYHCEICGSNFGRRSILNRHRKRHERDAAAAAVAAGKTRGSTPTATQPNAPDGTVQATPRFL